MDQLRRMFNNAGSFIGQMNATQKLLIASLAVIASMTLFLVSQYASKPSLVDLVSESGDTAVLTALHSAGIDAQVENGTIRVPPAQRSAAVAILAQSGQLPGDTQLMFNNLIQSQDWKASREQHQQQRTIALQNELARIIADFRLVHKASVVLDIPQQSGLGRAARSPTASVTIFTNGGSQLAQDTVDAAAGLVMGAVSGLRSSNIKVVDGSTGAPRRVSDEDSRLSTKYLEFAREVEDAKRHQIEDMLSHIPGIKVSVTATVDVTSVASTERSYAPEAQGSVSLLKNQNGSEDTSEQASRAAEAGVRSNQTASINQGGSAGNRSSEVQDSKEFENQFGYTERQIIDPRGMPTNIRASIVIPEEYVAELVARASGGDEGADAEAPDPTVVKERFEGVAPDRGLRGLIEQQVLPHLLGQDENGQPVEGEVVVSMIPFGDAYRAAGRFQSAGFMNSFAGGGGGGIPMLGGGNLVETVLVGILAIVAVFMMLTMVKRTGKRVALPTAEELVGVPPQFEGMEDLIGEADESEGAITGIEVDDATVQIQKLRDQVAELITKDPQSAATMVERWADVEM